MADHGDNYTRITDPEGNEVGKLGPECGHHCGVITVGHAGEHVAHCHCNECHHNLGELQAIFTSESGGVNPRGII